MSMRMWNDVSRSIDVVLFIDGHPLGAQTNATLNRAAAPIDITNQIDGEWEENLAGKKSWAIQCGGLYVVNDEALQLLEDAFMQNSYVDVKFGAAAFEYEGKALITDFPLGATFNEEFKYNLKLLGSGPLKRVEKDVSTNP